MRKALQVAALENGTAIDHIPPQALFKVVSLLQLQQLNNRITIGNNLRSSKIGKKGIIKVADKFFEEDEINRIALVAPNVTLNIIKNYEVIEKKKVILPNEIIGIVKCNNPKCITNNEPMSGGQMQRVAIARALVNNPAVILADEATGNLDTRTSYSILKLFQELHREGKTIVFVTHNNEIASFSERNIVLRDGKIISDTYNQTILSAAEALERLPKEENEEEEVI
jgi:aspartate carbamoyltransferase regulatory subunit